MDLSGGMPDFRKGIVAGLILALVFYCLASIFSGCSPAKGEGSPHAVQISSPDGSSCYAIMNAKNEIVGGNCK